MTAPAPAEPAPADATAGALAPFRSRAFLLLWIATVVSNVGTWMNDVGAGWLMATLAPSPAMVALVQAATTLPIFLFALPAGALADILDRRRLLLAVNLCAAVVAALFAAVVALELATPAALLAATFLLGATAAFAAPAWQAVVPGLVPRAALAPAIALNSLGINISRAIGPVLGGVAIVALGLYAPFAVNAVSTLGIVAALLFWRPPPRPERTLPPEHVWAAMCAGLRYARHSGPLRATLARAAAFFLFASCFWAMAPLIVRDVLQAGPEAYGLLMGSVGAGAVTGAFLLPTAKRRLGAGGTADAATLLTAAAMAALALVGGLPAAMAAAALAGLAWIAMLSTLQVSAQSALPDWVRARGLSLFLTVFFGAMTLGSLAWGQVASRLAVPDALLIAAAGALIILPLARRARLGGGATRDLAPSMHWPPPPVAQGLDARPGPVAVTVEYAVPDAARAAFLALMAELAPARRRAGAYTWSLMEDAAEPGRFVESFRDASWTDHLRHHARVTGEDRAVQARIAALLGADAKPAVRHYVMPAAAGAEAPSLP